jgi:hypothetical protein
MTLTCRLVILNSALLLTYLSTIITVEVMLLRKMYLSSDVLAEKYLSTTMYNVMPLRIWMYVQGMFQKAVEMR